MPIVSNSWATSNESPFLFPKFQAIGLHFDVQDLNETAPFETVLFCQPQPLCHDTLRSFHAPRDLIGVFSMKQRLSVSSDNDVKADPPFAFDLCGEACANDSLATQELTGSQPVSGCPLTVPRLVNLKRETGLCLPLALACLAEPRANKVLSGLKTHTFSLNH